jgi:hypothetical protein
MVTVGSLHELHKTSSLMFGTLHHIGALDFVVTAPFKLKRKNIYSLA